MIRILVGAVALLAALLASGCASRGDPRAPIPTRLVPAPEPTSNPRLVVVLPGRHDSIATLDSVGIAAAVQRQMPHADVLLTGAGMPYYRARTLARRLHDDVVAPARQRGVEEIWLLGASLGGMGALQFEREYPARVDRIVLLAPYLGERAIVDDIAAAGGPLAWQPSRAGAAWERELWNFLVSLHERPDVRERIWIGYGVDDRLAYAYPPLHRLLPPTQVSAVPGGHTWEVWLGLAESMLARAGGPGAQAATRP